MRQDYLLYWMHGATESEWVKREVTWAREAHIEDPEYRVFVVLRGTGRVSARRVLGEELLFLNGDAPLETLTAEIRAALGLRAPAVRVSEPAPSIPLLEELILEFSGAHVEGERVVAHLRVFHRPAKGPQGESRRFGFQSPISPIELGPVNTKGRLVVCWGYENHRVPISSDRGLLSALARQCEHLQSRSA